MQLNKTALILIGYQNDYFAQDGILNAVIEESSRINNVLHNTIKLLDSRGDDFGLVIATPIIFTQTYEELADPVGILHIIKDVGAFKAGSRGAQMISELEPYTDLIKVVPGKRGLNAFSNTQLADILAQHDIDSVMLAGAVTSVCIDSTGRDAVERGFQVSVLSDCTSGRSMFEQEFYCEQVFPLYARVMPVSELAER